MLFIKAYEGFETKIKAFKKRGEDETDIKNILILQNLSQITDYLLDSIMQPKKTLKQKTK